MVDIVKLIDNLSLLIIYIFPGIVFISIFCFITNKKSQKDNGFLLTSIIISYIIVSCIRFLNNITDISLLSVTAISLAAVASVIVSVVTLTLVVIQSQK